PETAWSPPLIDLAHRELSQHSMPTSEGMTDSPPPGACPPPGHRHWSMHSTTSTRARKATPQPLLRPEQRAPSGVGVKDLRPLRGRPFGPIIDPDASPRRAHKPAENHKEKISSTELGLTGPAPSGMTAY